MRFRVLFYLTLVDFDKLTGLQVAILSHGEYVIIPEGTLQCVLTVGTAGQIWDVDSS